MVRFWGLALLSGLLLSVVAAQARGQNFSFSGKWILNEKESLGGNTSEKYYDEYTITITENGAELTIESKIVRKSKEKVTKVVYFTDKRGEINLIPSPNSKDIEVKSKTIRKNNSINGRYEFKTLHPKARQLGSYSGTYEYKLKDNGNRMIWIRTHLDEVVNTTSSIGQTYSTRGMTKWVFDRAVN